MQTKKNDWKPPYIMLMKAENEQQISYSTFVNYDKK